MSKFNATTRTPVLQGTKDNCIVKALYVCNMDSPQTLSSVFNDSSHYYIERGGSHGKA